MVIRKTRFQLMFQFKGNFFDQIDGVQMGSPLGPTFAEIFMAYFEEKYMELQKEHGVIGFNAFKY